MLFTVIEQWIKSQSDIVALQWSSQHLDQNEHNCQCRPINVYARFKGKGSKIQYNRTALVYSYPSPPNGWRQKLKMVMKAPYSTRNGGNVLI